MDSPLHHLKILRSDAQHESAVWLSAIIQEVWPYAANIAQQTLLEYVQPALEAAVPKGIPVPRFTKIDIGQEGLIVERVRVVERNHSPHDTGAVFEADISYDGSPHVQMAWRDFTFGVTKAKLEGRIEILLRPIINRIPLVAACQVGFINPPTLEFTLNGIAAFGNQFLIRDILHSTVSSVLGDMAVLPNRVGYKIVPDTDYFEYAAHPIGVLRVAAVRGEGFPATDRHAFKQAVGLSENPDVYLILRHGHVSFSTHHVDDQTNPEWSNQVFDFVLTSDSSSQQLLVEAHDYDFGEKDDFLGTATVLVSDLVAQGIVRINLHDSPEQASPAIWLAARWLPLSSDLRHLQHAIISHRSDTKRPKDCSYLLLSIDVDEAHRLPPKKRPFVRVTIGNHKLNTNAMYEAPGTFSVEDPDFERSFHIMLNGEINAGVRITYEILDLFSGEVLGHAFSTLSEAMEAGTAGRTYNFALLKAKRGGASLRVRVKLAATLDQAARPLWNKLVELKETYQTAQTIPSNLNKLTAHSHRYEA